MIEKGTTRVAIVSIDNLGWPAYLGYRSRKLIKGIALENILIGVTHTHSAPDAYGFTDEKGNTGADLKYLENYTICDVALFRQLQLQEQTKEKLLSPSLIMLLIPKFLEKTGTIYEEEALKLINESPVSVK